MNKPVRPRSDPYETRQRILETAEEHFRRIGYQKTAVADIASTLGMSAANIYRFFPSKAAINECICRRVLEDVMDLAFRIAQTGGSPAERLERLLVEVHLHHRRTMIKEKRVHDMVAAAMTENWENVEAFKQRFAAVIEGLIREGNTAGDFAVDDPARAAECVKTGFAAFVHPLMIEECMNQDLDLDTRSRMMAKFLVDALRPRAAKPG